MTRAEIILAVRYLVQELSTDSGALLDDSGNLLELLNDATEQTVLDLISVMPEQFLTTETMNLTAGTQTHTFTAKFWQIWKIAKNISGDAPREFEPIDPIDEPYYMETAETDSEPTAYYLLGDTLYWVPIPSETTAAYAKAWLVRPEAVTLAAGGPLYIPSVAHRLIVYQTAALVSTLLEKDPKPFMQLYARRFGKVTEVWNARHQNKPRFVKEGIYERMAHGSGLSVDRDVDW